jgi:hypothetical protein
MSAFIRQTSAPFLIHQHGFVGQLEPNSTCFFVFQSQGACAGLNREHPVPEAFAMHMEKTRLGGIGFNANAGTQLAGQVALVNLLSNQQLGGDGGQHLCFWGCCRRQIDGMRWLRMDHCIGLRSRCGHSTVSARRFV